jgi:hypothetical protein
MSEIFTGTITGPSAWKGRDFAGDTSWIYNFTSQELAELDAALWHVASRGMALERIDRADFALPTLAPKLAAFLEEIRLGRGFVVLRGLPVENYTDDEVGTIFWGIGTHLGTAVKQNPLGDLLGHVYDHGRRYGDIDVRGYETNAHLPFHTDGCDLVGLLCLRRAKSGGLSSIVSAVAIHNEIARTHPEYLRPLYRGYHYIKREAALTDDPVTPTRIPVFGYKDGCLSARLVRNQINAACVKRGIPLAGLEREALDYLDALAYSEDFHLDMDLQLGDMQLINNYTILHSRTGFEDWPEPERRRHMVRLWLSLRERRPLAQQFPEHSGYRAIAEIAFERGAAALAQ